MNISYLFFFINLLYKCLDSNGNVGMGLDFKTPIQQMDKIRLIKLKAGAKPPAAKITGKYLYLILF